MAFYPLVGLVIGGLLAGLAWLLGRASLAHPAPLLPVAPTPAVWVGPPTGRTAPGRLGRLLRRSLLFVPVSRERAVW